MAVAVARPLQSGNGKHIDVEVTLRSFVRLIEQAVPSAILRQAGGLDYGQAAPLSIQARTSSPNLSCVPGTGSRPAPGCHAQAMRSSLAR